MPCAVDEHRRRPDEHHQGCDDDRKEDPFHERSMNDGGFRSGIIEYSGASVGDFALVTARRADRPPAVVTRH
jgi:hypothetical protein